MRKSAFEQRLDLLEKQPILRETLLEVCEVADCVRFWLDGQSKPATLADIVAMTAVVMEQVRYNAGVND